MKAISPRKQAKIDRTLKALIDCQGDRKAAAIKLGFGLKTVYRLCPDFPPKKRHYAIPRHTGFAVMTPEASYRIRSMGGKALLAKYGRTHFAKIGMKSREDRPIAKKRSLIRYRPKTHPLSIPSPLAKNKSVLAFFGITLPASPYPQELFSLYRHARANYLAIVKQLHPDVSPSDSSCLALINSLFSRLRDFFRKRGVSV